MTTYYRTDYHFACVQDAETVIIAFPDPMEPRLYARPVSAFDRKDYRKSKQAEYEKAFLLATVQLARKAGIDLAQVRKEVEV